MVSMIGTRVVKTFGTGEGLRRVVTETIDGKTFTKVFDREGTMLKERVSQNTLEQVGDKFIRRRTKVAKENDNIVVKTIRDRVYANDGKTLLGARYENYVDGKKLYSTKQAANSNISRTKYFSSNGMSYRRGYLENSNINAIDRCTDNGQDVYLEHNLKGLPKPSSEYSNYQYSDLSLKEMRTKLQAEKPYLNYAYEEFKLGALDDKVNNQNLNNLDMYL